MREFPFSILDPETSYSDASVIVEFLWVVMLEGRGSILTHSMVQDII
jgi:hypothetical protein